MEQRLTPEQLKLVIAEVQELDRLRQEDLDAEEVRVVLQELNLPPALLEDAIIQLQRRQALAAQRQRQRWWWAGIIGAGIAVALGWSAIAFHQQQQLNQVIAQTDRLTLAADDGSSRQAIDRASNNQIFYRLTLARAPVGQSLDLSCTWSDPSGQIAHQNKFQTKTITTPVWQTVCRHSIGPNTPPGNWQVRAFLGNRMLSNAQFTIR